MGAEALGRMPSVGLCLVLKRRMYEVALSSDYARGVERGRRLLEEGRRELRSRGFRVLHRRALAPGDGDGALAIDGPEGAGLGAFDPRLLCNSDPGQPERRARRRAGRRRQQQTQPRAGHKADLAAQRAGGRRAGLQAGSPRRASQPWVELRVVPPFCQQIWRLLE